MHTVLYMHRLGVYVNMQCISWQGLLQVQCTREYDILQKNSNFFIYVYIYFLSFNKF